MNDLCVFAVKRGNVEKRLDTHFYLPQFKVIIDKIKCNNYLRIGDIVTFSKETTDFSEYINGTFEYLEISGVGLGNNVYHTTTTEVINAPSRAKMKTQIGDIVISTTRPHRGAITEIIDSNVIASTGFSVIRNISEKIDRKWLLYTLLSELSLQQMLQRSSGGNYPAIIEDEIKQICIPLIDIATQKKTVSKLEKALLLKNDRLKQSNKLLTSTSRIVLDKLGLYKVESLLSKTSGYLFNIFHLDNTNDDLTCYAVTLSNIIEDGTFSAEYYHPERMAALRLLKSNIAIPAFKLSSVVSFHRNIVSCANDTDYLGLAGVESQTGELSGVQEDATGQALVYEKDDILYSRLRPYLNKVLLAEKGGICSTEFHVMRVIDTETVLPEYIATILRSDLILSQTKHMMTGNTHPRISNDDVKNLYIPVPDLLLQKTIVDELRKHRNKARNLKLKAEQEWQSAKDQFEKELLGGGA